MKNLKHFIQFWKFFYLIPCFFAVAQAITNSSDYSNKGIVCVSLSPEEVNANLKMTENGSNPQLRSVILESVFESFQNPQEKAELYKIFLERIYPMFYSAEEKVEEQIKENDIYWQDLKAFLEFYKPQGVHYESFGGPQRQIIDVIYAHYNKYL
jgi:hypothetical protein